MSVEQVDAVAQGRVWSGTDALKAGLVDQLGGYEDAIELAADIAKLGDDYDVEYFDENVSIGDAIGLRIRVALAGIIAPLLPEATMPVVPRALAPLLAEAQRLARLSDPSSVFAYCIACSVD